MSGAGDAFVLLKQQIRSVAYGRQEIPEQSVVVVMLWVEIELVTCVCEGCRGVWMNGFSNNLMVIELLRGRPGYSQGKFAIFIRNVIFNPFIAAN